MLIWNPAAECLSRDELSGLQTERLIKTVRRVYENVPFYRKKMDDKGILPDDIRSMEDLPKLPFTSKQDLRDNYPFGLFATPMSDIVRIHASSGTTGKQTVVGYTKNDIDIWAEVMARTLVAAGVDKSSFVQVAYGYGLFTGGLGVHYGVEKVGATVIPMSGGNTKRQLQIMEDFGTTNIACTPSYALYLAEEIETNKIERNRLHLVSGVFGAEPWSENMRTEIEERLKIKAYDIYGLSEVIGPGVSFECYYENGLHIPEDHFLPEIIDIDTELPVKEGQEGELVFTTITKEGLPLIRYRTHDISSLYLSVCECGRTEARMKKVTGRTDDMLIIRGVNVFPSQIESVLLESSETAPHYQIIVDRIGALDSLEVLVEMTPELFSDEIKRLEDIEKRIRRDIESTLGISAIVRLVEPKTIARSEGKAKRVIDKRKM